MKGRSRLQDRRQPAPFDRPCPAPSLSQPYAKSIEPIAQYRSVRPAAAAAPLRKVARTAGRRLRRRFVDVLAEDVSGDANILHLAIECRAPDAEFSSHLRHLSVIMGEREADRLGLDVVELAH